MGYHYTTSSFTVSTVGWSAESSVHIVSFLLKLPSTECHAGAGIFVRESLFFESWKLQWLVIWRLVEILAIAPLPRSGKPRPSLPVADPTSGLTILFCLLINSITILQGLGQLMSILDPYSTQIMVVAEIEARKSQASKRDFEPIFLAPISEPEASKL